MKRLLVFIILVLIFQLFLVYLTTGQKQTTVSKGQTITSMKTGSVIFSWYYCPPDGKTCIPNRWKYHPPGTSTAYPDGSFYNPENPTWWMIEASDMTCAGLDIAFIYLWDSGNWDDPNPKEKYKYINNVSHLINAVKSLNSPLKIAEYWDASYAGGGDLSDVNNAQTHYQRFIKPFYQLVPKDLWARENNRPILVVYRYGSDKFTNPQKAEDFFKNIKSFFKQDFGVEPFLILGHVWTWGESTAKNAADGISEMFPSATCSGGNAKIQTHNGYTTATIAAGAWDDNNPGGCHLERNNDSVLRLGFSQIPQNNNLLMIESWNELGEGSAIERAVDYPKNGGNFLPETYYLDTLRNLLGKTNRPACQSLTTQSLKNQPLTGTQATSPPSADTTINFNPQNPAADADFKVVISSTTGYTWVHMKIFDKDGKNLVQEASKKGDQPKVGRAAGAYQWTYDAKGLPSKDYKVVFYSSCDRGCKEQASRLLSIGAGKTNETQTTTATTTQPQSQQKQTTTNQTQPNQAPPTIRPAPLAFPSPGKITLDLSTIDPIDPYALEYCQKPQTSNADCTNPHDQRVENGTVTMSFPPGNPFIFCGSVPPARRGEVGGADRLCLVFFAK